MKFKKIFALCTMVLGVSGCSKVLELSEEFKYNDFNATVIKERNEKEDGTFEVDLYIENTGTKWIVPESCKISEYKYNKKTIRPSCNLFINSDIGNNYFSDCCIQPGGRFELDCTGVATNSNYLEHLDVFAINPNDDFEKITINKIETKSSSSFFGGIAYVVTLNNPCFDEKEKEYEGIFLFKYLYNEETLYLVKNKLFLSTNEELSIELSSANYDKPDESIIFQEVSIIDISENDAHWFICDSVSLR